MAKTKIQKKKTNKKLTIAAFEKKIKNKKIVTTKKNLPKTKPVKNKISNKPKVKTTSKIAKNNIKTINKKIEPKIPEIYDQELDSDVEIPIIEKTLNKKDKTIKQLSNDEIQEKIEAKVKEKLDAKIDKKIEEKLAANNQDIKEKEKEKRTVTIGSRKIVKKEDVFSKIGEWFSSLTNDINKLRNDISGESPSGGGDGPEDFVGAYKEVFKMAWRSGTKVIIHIADAPAHCRKYCGSSNHEEESGKLEPLLKRCATEGIKIICFDIRNGCKRCFETMRADYLPYGKDLLFNIENFDTSGSSEKIANNFKELVIASAACAVPKKK